MGPGGRLQQQTPKRLSSGPVNLTFWRPGVLPLAQCCRNKINSKSLVTFLPASRYDAGTEVLKPCYCPLDKTSAAKTQPPSSTRRRRSNFKISGVADVIAHDMRARAQFSGAARRRNSACWWSAAASRARSGVFRQAVSVLWEVWSDP